MSEKVFAIIESILAIFIALPTVISIAKQEKLYAIISGSLLAIFVIISLLFFASKKNKKHDSKLYRKILYFLSNKGRYILKSREVFYEYKDMTHINHSKKFNVVAKVDGIDSITDRYVYSGETECTVHAIGSGQKIIDQFKDHGWNFYSIKLSTPMAKNSSQIFEMKMDTIIDQNKTAVPFLSTGIYEPTKKLKMEITFGNNIIPRNAKIQIYRDYVDRNPIITHNLNFDTNNCKLTYELDYPILYYKYLILWDF